MYYICHTTDFLYYYFRVQELHQLYIHIGRIKTKQSDDVQILFLILYTVENNLENKTRFYFAFILKVFSYFLTFFSHSPIHIHFVYFVKIRTTLWHNISLVYRIWENIFKWISRTFLKLIIVAHNQKLQFSMGKKNVYILPYWFIYSFFHLNKSYIIN